MPVIVDMVVPAMAAMVRSVLAVKRVHVSHVVEAANIMQVPELHGIDLLGILVLSDRLLVDVRDRPHPRIELRLEYVGEAAMGDGGLLQVHLAALGGALADDLDGLIGPCLEEVDTID